MTDLALEAGQVASGNGGSRTKVATIDAGWLPLLVEAAAAGTMFHPDQQIATLAKGSKAGTRAYALCGAVEAALAEQGKPLPDGFGVKQRAEGDGPDGGSRIGFRVGILANVASVEGRSEAVAKAEAAVAAAGSVAKAVQDHWDALAKAKADAEAKAKADKAKAK